MGDYASTTELKERYENDAEVAHLTLDAETGTPDDVILGQVIDFAEGQINASLATRYLVPVDVSLHPNAGTFLKGLTLDMASYHLENRTGVVTPTHDKVNDQSLDWLEKVSKGEVLLPATASPAFTESRGSLARFGTADTSDSTQRVMTRATQSRL